jgi:hypothetical protein
MKKADRMAAWLAAFERNVIELDPTQCGKINWDTAKYYFYTGIPASEAAAKYKEK